MKDLNIFSKNDNEIYILNTNDIINTYRRKLVGLLIRTNYLDLLKLSLKI